MSETKTAQGSRVQQELEQLRQKQLAKSRRDKLKDLCSPLTTPEEAQAFLAAMRDKSHQREFDHRPPSNLTADGMDAWFMQQRQRERELRQRRKEAEALLRGYRGSVDTAYYHYRDGDSVAGGRHSLGVVVEPPLSTTSAGSEISENPFGSAKINLAFDLEKEGEQKDEERAIFRHAAANDHDDDDHDDDALPTIPSQEEKKSDDNIPVNVQNSTSGEQSRVSSEFTETTIWRDFISGERGAKFAPEPGRYHLYCSYACPGSHRALIIRKLKGLEHVITVTYLHPTWRLTNPLDPNDKHRGWVFGDPDGMPFTNTIGRGGPFPAAYPGTDPDPLFNALSIREIYERAQDNSGKYTIPLLWDKKLNTIVNNDSSDISYMLNSSFNAFARNPYLDLYTEDDEEGRAKLSEVCSWMSPLMIHGVYKCGFAKSQRSYDRAIAELCAAFDRADDILQHQRYLTGDTLTDADIRLFVTLLRFDEVYAVYFKCNARLVLLTPSLLNFCREIYQIKGVAETCRMDQIKAHFYGSHAEWNKYSVVPRGLGFVELLEMPHDRDQFEVADDREVWNEFRM